MIHSIKIKNFKSIGDNEQALENLGPINICVGENNSGKTAILEMLWIFAEILLNLSIEVVHNPLNYIEDSFKFEHANFLNRIRELSNLSAIKKLVNQEKDNIEVELSFEGGNLFRQAIANRLEQKQPWLEKKLKDHIKDLYLIRIRFKLNLTRPSLQIQNIGWGNIDLIKPYNDTIQTFQIENYLNLPDRDQAYSSSKQGLITSSLFKEAMLPEIREFLSNLTKCYYVHSKRVVKENITIHDSSKDIKGTNLKKILFDAFHESKISKKKYETILNQFNRISGESIRRDPLKIKDALDLVFEQGDFEVSIDQSGYGYIHLLSLIYNILISEAKIFLIDEPEISFHPQMQIRFLQFIKDIAEGDNRKQFFIATHSPYFIDLEMIDCSYKFTKNGNTVIKSIRDENLIKKIKEKKDGIFHFKHRELFFMKQVIFVEGVNDLNVLPEFIGKEGVSKEFLYHLEGLNDSKIENFSIFCQELDIKYAFVADVDFLSKENNKRMLIKKIESMRSRSLPNKEFLSLLKDNNSKKELLRRFWEINWLIYWRNIKFKDFINQFIKRNIFIMPYSDVTDLTEGKDDLNKETSVVLSEVVSHLGLKIT